MYHLHLNKTVQVTALFIAMMEILGGRCTMGLPSGPLSVCARCTSNQAKEELPMMKIALAGC
ncbi:hypothetical protein ACH79_33295 [Bradyrhizobium sp. CCBAU 051011]|nr:hypothetical protein ACH79_33295 [Bradyrhizobium sp. CCBAU 051011]